MTARPALSIVIPAFNEATRISRTLAAVRERCTDPVPQVVVVDDGSVDDTALVARAAASASFPVEVLVLPVNRGKGAAVRAGVAATTGDAILVMDADLATDLAAIEPALALVAADVDVVVGSRAVPGSSVRGATGLRRAMGRSFNYMVRAVTRLEVHDSQCGFKAFRGDVGRLLLALSEVDGFAYDPEVLFLARILGYRMVEIPVDWTAVEGSTVRPVRDSVVTGAALCRIVTRRHPRRVRAEAGRLGWAPRTGDRP